MCIEMHKNNNLIQCEKIANLHRRAYGVTWVCTGVWAVVLFQQKTVY